jgi:uncharacterized protein
MRVRSSLPLFLPLLAIAIAGCGMSGDAQIGGSDGGDSSVSVASTPGLWEISSGTNKCYLFASLEAGRDDMYPLTKEVDDAFANATTFVIACNPEAISPAHVSLFLDINGKYPERELYDHLSPETADLLREYCGENKLPLQNLEQWKPWAIAMTISTMELQKRHLDAEKGVDKHFLKKASSSKKTVIELESARNALERIVRLDPKTQELLLLLSLKQWKNHSTQVQNIITAWKNGNIEALNKALRLDPIEEEPRLRELFVNLVDERSALMAAKITQRLKAGGQAFILVSAGNLPGEKGIFALLEKKGFTVKQVAPVK